MHSNSRAKKTTHTKKKKNHKKPKKQHLFFDDVAYSAQNLQILAKLGVYFSPKEVCFIRVQVLDAVKTLRTQLSLEVYSMSSKQNLGQRILSNQKHNKTLEIQFPMVTKQTCSFFLWISRHIKLQLAKVSFNFQLSSKISYLYKKQPKI